MNWDEWRGSFDGRPTMWVRYLFKRPWLQVALHKFVAPDDPDCFHSHPAFAVRVILWGGYYEEILAGPVRAWIPGMLGIVTPTLCHRIAGLRRMTSYSLWIRFRKIAEVKLYGTGWDRQRVTP